MPKVKRKCPYCGDKLEYVAVEAHDGFGRPKVWYRPVRLHKCPKKAEQLRNRMDSIVSPAKVDRNNI